MTENWVDLMQKKARLVRVSFWSSINFGSKLRVNATNCHASSTCVAVGRGNFPQNTKLLCTFSSKSACPYVLSHQNSKLQGKPPLLTQKCCVDSPANSGWFPPSISPFPRSFHCPQTVFANLEDFVFTNFGQACVFPALRKKFVQGFRELNILLLQFLQLQAANLFQSFLLFQKSFSDCQAVVNFPGRKISQTAEASSRIIRIPVELLSEKSR